MSAPAPLNYVPRARRPWKHRLRRWWPVGLILVALAVSIAYGPKAWRHYKFLQLQDACMKAEMPTDRPVYQEDRDAANVLVGSHLGEYHFDYVGRAARDDPRWVKLATELGITIGRGPPPYQEGTTFLHECFTPSGRRRLVVGSGLNVTVIEPAGWFHRAGLINGSSQSWNPTSERTMYAVHFDGWQFNAGSTDPSNRSRFVIPATYRGMAVLFEFQLHDDDSVTKRMMDPDVFLDRVKERYQKRGLE